MKDIAVLLTVRDWDLTRVEMCLRSVQNNEGVSSEIVLIDYGSKEARGVAALAAKYKCTFKRVEATEWSRSKAMNIAASLAESRNLIFADADLAFSPKVLSSTVEKLDSDPLSVLLFQFRDLPSGITADQLIEEPNFEQLDTMAVWRPRWGMGVQAYPTAIFNRIRGFDNRMKIYGGEDNDIAKRARANGARLEWVNGEQFGLYHVWHPSSREVADSDPETKAELQKNVDIAKNDRSKIRNLQSWTGNAPLVSVVMTTYNRAEYLTDSIRSVLTQTCPDFEFIILDDGSTDNTAEVVQSFEDRRIRYIPGPKVGIPRLRNRALELTRGRYTAIHDDDDIMLPWSLETRLSKLEGGMAGAYGGAFDFDNELGAMSLFPGRSAELASVLNGAKVFYHATLLIESNALRAVKYDEAFQSGSDFNLALRLMKAGVKLAHCGDVVLLRRLHRRQVTVTDQSVQHGASYASTFAQRASWGAGARWKSREKSKALGPWAYEDTVIDPNRFYPYLPSHLVSRSLLVSQQAEALYGEADLFGELHSDQATTQVAFIADASPVQLAAARELPSEAVSQLVVPNAKGSSRIEGLRAHIRNMLNTKAATIAVLNPDLVDNGFIICKSTAEINTVELSMRFAGRMIVDARPGL